MYACVHAGDTWKLYNLKQQTLTGLHLGKPLHVVLYNLWVRTLQFLYDVKTLVKLSEHIHHWRREQVVFRALLELQPRHNHNNNNNNNDNNNNYNNGTQKVQSEIVTISSPSCWLYHACSHGNGVIMWKSCATRQSSVMCNMYCTTLLQGGEGRGREGGVGAQFLTLTELQLHQNFTSLGETTNQWRCQ